MTDRDELRRLAPFMRGEITVTQAAQELGLSVTATFKLVQRYGRWGLLQETRQEQRAGRNRRYYQAPSAYFVPFSVRSSEQVGERNRAAGLRQFEHQLSATMRRNLPENWGVLSSFTPSGETYYEIVSDQGKIFQPEADDAPVILAGWNRLALTGAEARILQRQLLALVLPYLNREARGDLYQLGIFLTPNAPGSAE
ncbi:hypothetical protein MF271_22530 (plasmid) [Deinococcus sp. KNUC1210]|uniref:hypothetical protein n=1 Tax=Deinococcus sp. KNUC1210 TaxID=2917691 RepID=UPI001EF1033C|nr:hypothetical protein [Deinococcus sp. KNUC1210]ULH18245.1 hypothetical protein MF271_22530 [Deinococcus sp. KNUC1210]